MRHSLHALPLLALGLLLHPLLTSCQEGSSSLPLVINEVHATPPEWVEILNLSDQAQPLRDVQLMGSDADGNPTEERTQLPDIAILPNEHLVDLIMTVAFYNGVVRVLGSLKIDVEPDYQTYLARHPLPPKSA